MKKIFLTALTIMLTLSSEPVSAQTQKGVSKQFADMMAAGKYTMMFRIEQTVAGQTVSFEAEQYVSGDKMALVGKQGDHNIKIVVRDGKAYMIDDTSKKIFAMPDANAAKEMGVNIGKISASGYGHETFREKDLPYDEYVTDKGKIRMYVNGGTLAGLKVILKDEAPVIIETVSFSDKVNERIFNLPSGYGTVN